MILSTKNILFFLIILLFIFNCFASDDFTHTLNLAKYSACKDVIEHTQQSNNPIIHQSKLKALCSGPFPYRFEITNGYQEGFVYYALLGYANELSGNIPLAYRCYQNSLACIDEDKSFNYPLPRAEIYLALGRTCLAAGRYLDAKDWLDNAFLESGNNLQLQAAIDRVLIQRGNELGDYPEIIFLYQHLEQLQGLKVATPAFAGQGLESGKCKNSPPVLGGVARSDGVVEQTTDYGLRTTDYANYAQILFYSRKDREGFSKLLEGISKLGIDNNLGVKDPLVDKFLNNIMRAEDDEVKWFYDLLGWAIVDARAKAGDEDYLAFLCNARTLFCKVYDFLNPEDDLKKVKERIDEVKRQLANGYDVFGKESRSEARDPRPAKKKRMSKTVLFSESGEVQETPEVELEDLIMQADWCRRQKRGHNAWEFYISTMPLITNNINLQLVYDGVNPIFAIESGKALLALDYWYGSRLCGYKVTNYTDVISTPLEKPYGNSLRHCIFYSTAYLCMSYDDFPTVLPDNIQSDLYPLLCDKSPLALPSLKRVFESNINQAIFFGKYRNAEEECRKMEHHFGVATENQYQLWGGLYLLRGELNSAFAVWFRGAILTRNFELLNLSKSHIPWASNEYLEEFSKALKAFELSSCIKKWPVGITRFRSALEWNSMVGEKERKLRRYITEANWESALLEIKNKSTDDYRKSIILLKLGHTNDAVQTSLKELQNRMTFLNADKINYLILPSSDSKLIISCLANSSFNTQNEYFQWLNTLKNKAAKKLSRLSGLKSQKSKICTKKISMLNKYISILDHEINQIIYYVPGVTNNLSGEL